MSNVSRTYLLIQERLGSDLAEFATEARRNGGSWHSIAFDLSNRTGVLVTPQTLGNWFPNLKRGEAA